MSGIILRRWQEQLATTMATWTGDNFLVVASPGSGKTIGAGAALIEPMKARGCDQLIVVCPTTGLRSQWAEQLYGLGFKLDPNFKNRVGAWSDGIHGVAVTYQQVARRPELFRSACRARPTAVVLDEIHHGGDSRKWGEALQYAFGLSRLRLGLSATPFRSDEDQIPFVSYEDGQCRPNFKYGYREGLEDGICRPVEFHRMGGFARWTSGGKKHHVAFGDRKATPKQRRQRLRAAVSPNTDFALSLLDNAHRHLVKQREVVPDAAGLVVAQDQEEARAIANLMVHVSGCRPPLIISDDPSSHRRLSAFARDDAPWLVAVRMVSEGIDIQRLTTLAWLTTTKTELFFRQVVGRIARVRPDDPTPLNAAVFLPDDEDLYRFALRLIEDPEPFARKSKESNGASCPDEFPLIVPTRIDVLEAVAESAGIIPAPIAHRRPGGTRRRRASTAPELTTNYRPVRATDRVVQLAEAEKEVRRLIAIYEVVRRRVRPGEREMTVQEDIRRALGVAEPKDANANHLAKMKSWIEDELRGFLVSDPERAKRGILEAKARGLSVVRADQRVPAIPQVQPKPTAPLREHAPTKSEQRASVRPQAVQSGTGTPLGSRFMSEDIILEAKRIHDAEIEPLAAIARKLVDRTEFRNAVSMAACLSRIFKSRGWIVKTTAGSPTLLTDELLDEVRTLYQEEGLSYKKVAERLLEKSQFSSVESFSSAIGRAFQVRGWARRDKVEAVRAANHRHGLRSRAAPQKDYAAFKKAQEPDNPVCEAIVKNGPRAGERCDAPPRPGMPWCFNHEESGPGQRFSRGLGQDRSSQTLPTEPLRGWLNERYKELGSWNKVAALVDDTPPAVHNRKRIDRPRVLREVVETWLTNASTEDRRWLLTDLYESSEL